MSYIRDMKYLRFYYFSFLYFYKDKPLDWISEYRSFFLVLITIISILSFILLLLYPNLIGIYSYARLGLIVLFILLGVLFQYTLIHSGKYMHIFEEFQNHAMNTKSNRIVCYMVWFLTFISPSILAVIQMGYIR